MPNLALIYSVSHTGGHWFDSSIAHDVNPIKIIYSKIISIKQYGKKIIKYHNVSEELLQNCCKIVAKKNPAATGFLRPPKQALVICGSCDPY